ncbi:MAG: 50S ribosomal protein L35 [Bdellovibrionales bacterium]|nr:50S ribosomal protein L35 [Bdellovibrionales bacterium]
MPKVKSKRAAGKRFRVGGTGTVKHGRAGVRHNTGKKRSKIKRNLRGTNVVDDRDTGAVKRMIPYAF